jgi:hypothetical protein
MKTALPPQTPEQWFRHLFAAKAALDGGVVRRKLRDIDRMVGRDRFLAEVERRGFSAIENAGQVVVFCNAEPVSFLVPRGANFQGKFAAKSCEDLAPDFR